MMQSELLPVWGPRREGGRLVGGLSRGAGHGLGGVWDYSVGSGSGSRGRVAGQSVRGEAGGGVGGGSGTWDVCGAVGSGQHLRSTQQIGVSPL